MDVLRTPLTLGSLTQGPPMQGPPTQGLLKPGPLGPNVLTQLASLSAGAAGPAGLALPSGTELSRIDEVAKGFEGMFLSTLLKQMRETLEPEGMFSGDRSDVLGGMFDMFLSQHLSQVGALGIAEMVKKQLMQTHESPADPAGKPRRTEQPGRAVPPTPGA